MNLSEVSEKLFNGEVTSTWQRPVLYLGMSSISPEPSDDLVVSGGVRTSDSTVEDLPTLGYSTLDLELLPRLGLLVLS